MEGDIWPGITRQMKLLHDRHDRVLPNIDGNIKCGNSLIGWDYFDDRLNGTVDPEERQRVRPFDWKAEFKPIMKAGGFDCVIGNPPYIRIHNLVDYYAGEVTYIQANYATAAFGKVDIYVAFVERALHVARDQGRVGFIVPNKFLQADYGVGLRRLLAETRGLRHLVDFQAGQVFARATTYTCLLFASPSSAPSFLAQFNVANRHPRDVLADARVEVVPSQTLTDGPWTLAYSPEQAICGKLERRGTPLGQVAAEMITGVKTGANDVFVLDQGDEPLREMVAQSPGLLKPYLKAEGLKRYHVGEATRLLIYPCELNDGRTRLLPPDFLQDSAPAVWAHLLQAKARLEARQKGALRGPAWYGLSFGSSMTMFEGTKIVTATLAPRNSFALDTEGRYFPQGAGGGMGIVIGQPDATRFILGVLNSRLLTFYFHRISSRFQGAWFAYEPRYVRRLPIRPIDFSDPSDVARHDKMVALVERMLELHRQLPEAKTAGDRELIERQIKATDDEIDALVYELYGLTDEEIAIVEGAT
jgi:hypothetical protein